MKRVDIVIPNYYTPQLTVRCLQSVVANTDFSKHDIKVIVVDDSGSSEFTEFFGKLLAQFDLIERIVLINHEENKGFVEACYTGIEYRESDYKLLLNSDTYVMPGWLEEMIKTAESEESIALVNPITNNTPEIEIPFKPGSNLNHHYNFVKNIVVADDDYLDIVTATGFCLLIKDKYIKKYGFFDRIFGKGYGEETDLHFRYITQGLRAVISPNAFVYHRGEASFSDTNARYNKNIKIVMDRYRDVYTGTIKIFHEKSALNTYRKNLDDEKQIDAEVLVISSSNSIKNGGVKVLHNITNILNEAGLAASFAYVFEEEQSSELVDRLYRPIKLEDLYEYDCQPKVIVYSLDNNAYDVVRYIDHIKEKYGYIPRVVHTMQDIEGWFWEHDVQSFIDYSKLADARISVSPFVQEVIGNYKQGLDSDVIINSLSLDFYGNYLKIKATHSNATETPVFATMLRGDQKRGAKVIEQALIILDKKLDRTVTIHGFGNFKVEAEFEHINLVAHGFVNEKEVMDILSKSNVFIEGSFYQGFGLTAFEAIFSGCEVISSNNRGAQSVLPESSLVTYFKLGDADNLAQVMKAKIDNWSNTTAEQREQDLFELMLNHSHFSIAPQYVKFFKQIIATGQPELADYYERAARVLLTYSVQYIDVPRYNQVNLPNRLRYRIADKISNLFESQRFIYKAGESVVKTIKEWRGN